MGGHHKGIIGVGGLGLLIGIVSLVMTVWSTPGGESARSYIAHFKTPPTCSKPEWLLQVPNNKHQISVGAYYYYDDHGPKLTLDEEQDTAWLQWWPATDFEGGTPKENYIHWDLSSTYDLRLICISDGWPKSDQTAETTELIKNATIDLMNKDCPVYNKTFTADAYTFQQVSVSCKTSNVFLYLNSTYPAAKTPYCALPPSGIGPTNYRPLTGISEIRFYYSPDWLRSAPWSAPTNQK